MIFRVGWLEFNVPFQHKCGYIRDEVFRYHIMIFYCSSVITKSLSCTVFEILLIIFPNLKRSCDLNTPSSAIMYDTFARPTARQYQSAFPETIEAPKFNNNSSGNEIANVNFFARHRTCTGQHLRPLNRLPNFYYKYLC